MSSPKQIKRILIANRGEIAIRIARTARRMGIETVALFSDPDRNSPHVKACDYAVNLPGETSAETYLQIDKIIKIAKEMNVDAIHPGYGFLSEKEAFAESLDKAGIIFIGPTAESIRSMGDKLSARRTMEAAGVPVVPGLMKPVASVEDGLKAAKNIGFPIMIKASAGGGGKGMRLVQDASEFAGQIEAAIREAEKAFGDGAVYLERYITGPHHIEVQVFGDGKGGAWHLFERECSIQRRHQKVVEEAPSPFLEGHEDVRKALYEVALKAVKSIKYRGAGTLEFIMGEDRQFYFLEMNTRLQVEHPITEWITGVDLVEQQIRIAEGKTPTLENLVRNGAAIECRIYAEDPKTFLPAPGKVSFVKMPAGPFVRHDTCVGDEVSMFYDPMISKVSVWGRTREEARTRMITALDETVILGVNHNISFNMIALKHADFIKGYTTTDFVKGMSLDTQELSDLQKISVGIAHWKELNSNSQERKTYGSEQLSPWQRGL